MLTSYLSYEYTVTDSSHFLIGWAIAGGVSTLYNSYWDWANDWGLLKIGDSWKTTVFLGRKLCYYPHKFYYAVIISNVFLRLVWAFNISLGLTDIIDNALGLPGVFKLVIYLLEMYRRCQWSLLKVEVEHLANCKIFKAVLDLDLPLKVNVKKADLDKDIDAFMRTRKTTIVTPI